MSEEMIALSTLAYVNEKPKGNDLADDYKEEFRIIVNALKVLEIIKKNPFILEKLFEEANRHDEYNNNYFWNTITDEEVAKVKEWLGI